MSNFLRTIDHLRFRLPKKVQALLNWRFVKFGMVGASGTVINTVVLYLSQEYLLSHIADFHQRLNYSIALAITCATISNFYWNRRLTWHDRRHDITGSAPVLFLKYVGAAALSIGVQSLLTKWLANHMHYVAANLVAIALASVCSFIANDRLTFRRRKHLPAPPPPRPHDKP
jgi:putative flippase GtrA